MSGAVVATALDCPECGGPVGHDTGEQACRSCGVVVEDSPIDHGPEWTAYDAAERDTQSRVGAPRTVARHDRGLGAEIGYDRDGVSSRKLARLGRQRRWNDNAKFESKADRNLCYAMGEVRRMAAALGLSTDLRNQACVLVRSSQEADLWPGRSIEAMATAALYATARCAQLGRQLEEFVHVSRVGERPVVNAFKAIDHELGIPAPPPRASSMVGRVSCELDLNDEERRRVRDLVGAVEDETPLVGRAPSSILAGAIYSVTADLTQDEIGEAARVVNVSLREAWRDIQDVLERDPGLVEAFQDGDGDD